MRLTRLPALALLAILTLSACGQFSAQPGVTPSLPPVTSTPTATLELKPSATPLPTLGVDEASLHGLTLQVWHAFAGPADDLFTQQVAKSNAENTWGITINPTGYGDYSGLFDAVNAALESGQLPDLVAALPEQTLAWDAKAVIVDLNPYLDNPQWGLTAADRTEIPSIFWAQDNVNARQLGLPAQRSARFLLYNQTWAHELGFDDPPATAEEFRRQACAANASFLQDKDVNNDGKGGWVVDTNWQTVYSWLLAFGGSVVKGSGYAFNTDPNLAALQFIKGLSDSHCAWPSETPYDSFASRTALFISTDLSELPAEAEAMASLKNPDEWTVIPFPGPQVKTLVTYGPSYTVLKSTPEKQLAAWLFARWLLSPKNQSRWVEQTGLLPLRNSVPGMIQSYRDSSPQWEAALGYLSLAQAVPQLASWRKARYLLEDGVNVLFLENLPVDKLATILEGMDSMAREIK